MENYGIVFGIMVVGGIIMLAVPAVVAFSALAYSQYGRYRRGDIGAFMVFLALGGCAAAVVLYMLMAVGAFTASMVVSSLLFPGWWGD